MNKSVKNNIPILSIIILNYNSGFYLHNCLNSINKSKLKDKIEVLVIDNFSTDNSFSNLKPQKIKNKLIDYQFIALKKNIGFSAGNNQGIKKSNSRSKYVLFLNPDTIVTPTTISQMIIFFKNNPKADAATCDLLLAKTGQTQPESHRGFPTPWNSFIHFFGFGLSKIFPKTKFFNGYFLGHLDFSHTQLIDACVGAFLMVKRNVGQKIGWWDESYFFYGEDLDFCWQLKKQGYSLYFYPGAKATHFQGISSGIIDHTKNLTNADRQSKIRSAIASTKAMKIFYQKNLINLYPHLFHQPINLGINFLSFYRLFKAKYL